MSFWTKVRDDVENVGLAVADYYTGGAASVLGGLRAKSAQDSTLGRIVGIGGELYGAYNLAAGAYNAAKAGDWGSAIAKGAGALSSAGGAAATALGAPTAQGGNPTGGYGGVGQGNTPGNSLLSNLLNAGVAYAGSNAIAPPPGPYNGGYTPPNLNTVANNITTAIGNIQNPLTPYMPQVNSAISGGLSQLNSLGQTLSGQLPGIASAYQNAGNTANQVAQAIFPYAQGLAAAGQQVWNTALDPQKALYNRTLNQVTQQDNAQQAARGIGMSPIGQELSNQAISNFNIDWQNQQLARQLAGLQGMGSADSTATNMGVAGSNLMNSAAQNAYLGAAMPYQLGSAAAMAPLNLLGSAYPLLNAGNVANAAQAQLGMGYMGLGQQGAALDLNAALAQAQARANGLNSLGQLGSQAANALKNLGNSSGYGTSYTPPTNYLGDLSAYNSAFGMSGTGNNSPYTWNAPTSTSLGSSFSDQMNGSYMPTSSTLDPTNMYFGSSPSLTSYTY